jgi:transcriptional regulator with XRE-family HTH domain
MPRPRTPAVEVPVDEKVIGERLRELRKRQGMSQAELAAELGLNQTAVSDYETGAARIHAAMLAALARVLRTSADEILGLSPTRTARAASPAPDRRFLRRLERLHQLSRRDQQALLGTIDAFLTKVS